MSIFNKVIQAGEAYLDGVIAKAKTDAAPQQQDEYADRKAQVELGVPDEQQYGYKEKTGMVGSGVLKNMARKDSIVIAIINTKLAQIHPFAKEQKDKYSPGWIIEADEPADIESEDKMSLADPELQNDPDAYAAMKYEMDQKRQKLKDKQLKDIEKIKEFIKHCGMPPEETDTTHRRWDFDKFMKTIVTDRLIYNYAAIELVPTKDGEKVHHFYPASSGTIRYVSQQSAKEEFVKQMAPIIAEKRRLNARFDGTKPFKYVQLVRGKIVAAFTEDEMIFEPASPTVDPEDNGYAPGELEMLVQIVTAHLYAEAHNRNFFTQGIGSKGILHIKGDNISRAQLEAFKRQWFNQVVNSRNAFRPPIIGMAEDVKWVSLAQTNQEMEFEKWMNYLIKISCAIFQIDPAEINFDISKTSNSLQEANNEEKLKASKDKGLRPLLDYVEAIVNNHILRYWDSKLADKYKFRFVGFDAESRKGEVERLQKETAVWKTLNEARIEMGFPPIESGDIVLNATYTQYIAQKLQQAQMDAQGQMDQQAQGDENAQNQTEDVSIGSDLKGLDSDISDALDESDADDQKESDKKEKEAAQKVKESAKKSTEAETPTIVEYYIKKTEDQE